MSKDKQTAAPEPKEQLNTENVVLTTDETQSLSLEEREAAVNLRELAVNERELNVEAREKALEEKETFVAAPEVIAGLEFEFEGEDFKFSDSAPKKILLNGKGRTQDEISKDENLKLIILDFGLKTGLIQKIN